MNPRLFPKCLRLILKSGYKEQDYLIKLEPYVEKSIELDSDMSRITQLEVVF